MGTRIRPGGLSVASANASYAPLASAPRSLTILGSAPMSASAGSWSVIRSTTGMLNMVAYTISAAANDYAEWPFSCAAGTYALSLLHIKDATRGIYSISLDGGAALGTTIDGYAAAAAAAIDTVTGIALAAGAHTVRLTTATKNGSAIRYDLGISALSITRTGA